MMTFYFCLLKRLFIDWSVNEVAAAFVEHGPTSNEKQNQLNFKMDHPLVAWRVLYAY